MNPVVHFEMPAEDRQRMMDFYSKTFGWQMQQLGSEMNDYVVATTTETDELGGRPKNPGAINGGFYQKGTTPETQAPSVVISVEDVHAHVQKIKDAGGTITAEPMEIPGVGLYAGFRDTEGNYLSILQPSGM